MVIGFMLFSCGTTRTAYRETPSGEERGIPPRYSIICIIHGDGEYLYHDSQGHALRADEEALSRAAIVATQNPQAEMFVFHERRRRHVLFFFPRQDGTLYYYRNGRLVAEEKYWRDSGPSRFAPEVELYHRFHAETQTGQVKLFLYFGHEIPEFGGAGYDASYAHRRFMVEDLAGGIEGFTHDSTKFDLMVLSTCFNGTPFSIAALTPYTRYIIASPGNLHLSYFDLTPLDHLDVRLRDGDVAAFAKQFAHQAFDRLIRDVQTEVTVAVYDANRVQEYVHAVGAHYEHTLATLEREAPAFAEHCDCAEDPFYVLPGMRAGVDLFYRPPQFGRSKTKTDHSGWECWRLSE
jgi:hypothetical protein